MLNILTEPLIRMKPFSAFPIKASLSQVYAALMADEVEAFPALRPHQRHAWHAFLVQLGAMAMHRSGVSEPPENASRWADLIRGLTPDYPMTKHGSLWWTTLPSPRSCSRPQAPMTSWWNTRARAVLRRRTNWTCSLRQRTTT